MPLGAVALSRPARLYVARFQFNASACGLAVVAAAYTTARYVDVSMNTIACTRNNDLLMTNVCRAGIATSPSSRARSEACHAR